MTSLATRLGRFLEEHLVKNCNASPNTIWAYRDGWVLLLRFARKKLGKEPSKLEITDLDAPFIGSFLAHLEKERSNCIRTRNARLAAIHSFFRYLQLYTPEHLDLIQRVLAIPMKRFERTVVDFLTKAEAVALVNAVPDETWFQRRDRALLALALQTGLRVSELTGLNCADLHLGDHPVVQCIGKGRKQRFTPLERNTIAVLRAWLKERNGHASEPLFPTRKGTPMSRDAVERIVKKYAKVGSVAEPTLATKRVSPHVLRHTAAVELARAGTPQLVLALWLGHESPDTTRIYVEADLAIKERALERTAPRNCKPGRYRPPDALLTHLEQL